VTGLVVAFKIHKFPPFIISSEGEERKKKIPVARISGASHLGVVGKKKRKYS